MEKSKYSWPGWETVRRIGSGGFGTVYEIQQDIYGDVEKAALKVITIPHGEDEVDYLRCKGLTDDNITQTFHRQVADISREYKLMAKMRDNPNVVRCDAFMDVQHEDGLGWDIYIKMELLTPLMKCLDKVQTEEQIRRLGMDMCNALVACQEKNIIHRDIKPQNIFLSDKGQFKLGDFGIARTAERTTRATAGIGTYSYMAPEVEKNEAYGKTADIYSLGLVLYWLLNERRSPFEPLPPAVPGYGDEENARNRRFAGEQIPAPKNGSKELKAIILKACAYDPKKRYQSAKDMRFALEALKAGTAAVTELMPVAEPIPAEDVIVAEDLTAGPDWHNTAKEPVAEDMTVGPTWGDAPVTEKTEVTVGPVFQEKKIKQPQIDPADKPKETQPKPQKKKWWVVVAAIVICAGIGISFFKKPADRSSSTEQIKPSETASIVVKENVPAEESIVVTTTETEATEEVTQPEKALIWGLEMTLEEFEQRSTQLLETASAWTMETAPQTLNDFPLFPPSVFDLFESVNSAEEEMTVNESMLTWNSELPKILPETNTGMKYSHTFRYVDINKNSWVYLPLETTGNCEYAVQLPENVWGANARDFELSINGYAYFDGWNETLQTSYPISGKQIDRVSFVGLIMSNDQYSIAWYYYPQEDSIAVDMYSWSNGRVWYMTYDAVSGRLVDISK